MSLSESTDSTRSAGVPRPESYILHWTVILLLVIAGAGGYFHFLKSKRPTIPPAVGEGKVDWFLIVELPELPTKEEEAVIAKNRMGNWLTTLEKEGFQPILLSEAIHRIRMGKGLPEKSVVLLFNPGYRGSIEAYAPILFRHKFPAVILTDKDAILKADHRLLSEHALDHAQASGWWDVGTYNSNTSHQFQLQTPAHLQGLNKVFHNMAWNTQSSGALNRGFQPTSLRRLSVNPLWTSDELVKRLKAEIPIQKPSYLTTERIQNYSWGTAVDYPRIAPLRFSISAPRDGRTGSVSWLGTEGLKEYGIHLQVPAFFGEMWLLLCSERKSGRRIQIGFMRDGTVRVEQKLSYQGQRSLIASYSAPSLQEGYFDCNVVLSGDALKLAINGVDLSQVVLPRELSSKEGVVELMIYDKVTGAARAEGINMVLFPAAADGTQIPLGDTSPAKPKVTLPPQPAPMSSWEEAVNYYRAGRYEESTHLYRKEILVRPKDTALLKDLMWILWRAKQFKEAGALATQVSLLHPEDLEAWDLRARTLFILGRRIQAFRVSQKILTLANLSNSVSPRLSLAQLYLDMQYAETAEDLLIATLRKFPEVKEIYPLLAKAQFFQGNFPKASQTWTQTVELFPNVPEYKFQLAQALYYNKEYSKAVDLMKELLPDPSVGRKALDFLANDAIATGDLQTAAQLMEQNLMGVLSLPRDEVRFFRLSKIWMDMNRLDKCLDAVERSLKLNPKLGEALLLKAMCLTRQNRTSEAIRTYIQILKLNPTNLEAIVGLSDLYTASGRPGQALRTLDSARRIDPTDAYLLIRESQNLYALGKENQARTLLTQWLEANPEPVLPILLYHGLTPSMRDPMLASPVHMTVDTFKSQLQALRSAGYEAITAEQALLWIQGKITLPKKSVLITFDDARLDSFRYADPILKKYELKATMFVPVVNVQRNLPGYATWSEIGRYRRSGRWEIQSHGDEATSYIYTDQQGQLGLFLVNLRWLEDGRLESEEEWKRRILNDYAISKKEIGQQVGKTPVAFAFPEGNFGQEGVPTAPGATWANLAMVRELYAGCFHQDSYGLNARSRSPYFMTRTEPRPNWNGEDIIQHISDRTPHTLMRIQLLRQAAWKRRSGEAYQWLNQLKKSQVSPSLLLVEEARIHAAMGDRATTHHLTQRALEMQESAPIRQAVEMLRREDRPFWSPSFHIESDSRKRDHWIFRQYLGTQIKGNHSASLHHVESEFSEDGVPAVYGRAIGVDYAYQGGLVHRLALRYLQHFFSGGTADNTFTAVGNVRSTWNDVFSTEVEVGRAPYETARALNANVRETRGKITGIWKVGTWEYHATGRLGDFSDGNNRTTLEAQVQKSIQTISGLKAVAGVTYDHMSDISSNYYTPQHLKMIQAGAVYSKPINKNVEMTVRYLPGYGKEENSTGKIVHFLEVGLPIRFGENNTLEPSFAISNTPTYRRKYFEIAFKHRF